MQSAFAPMKPLGYPSLDLVHSQSKNVYKELGDIRKRLQKETGFGLVLKQYDHSGKRSRTRSDNLSIQNNNANKSTDNDINDGSNNINRVNNSGYSNKQQTPKSGQFTITFASHPTPRSRQQNKRELSPPSSSATMMDTDAGPGTEVQRDIGLDTGWNIDGMSEYGHLVKHPPRQPTHTTLSTSPSSSSSASYSSSLLCRNRALPVSTEPCWPPNFLSLQEQYDLIELYYHHIHPVAPVLTQAAMLNQLTLCHQGLPSYLSPFYFYALFASASRFCDQTWHGKRDQCMRQAAAFRELDFGHSSLGSVLALLMMASVLESSELQDSFSSAWMLAGEAIRMVQDLGLQRRCNLPAPADDPECTQLAVRTFWYTFATDRVMSVTCGRSFVFEEKDIDVPMPEITPTEEERYPSTKVYLTNLHFLIDMSRVIGRIIRFNYSAQSAMLRGPCLHQEAMLSTLDSWISSLVKDSLSSQDDNMDLAQSHFDKMRQFAVYVLLILLHRPFVHDARSSPGKKGSESRPSFEICSHAATIITQLACEVSAQELAYHTHRAIALYALLTATRIHLMKASSKRDKDVTINGEISFMKSMDQLRKVQHLLQQEQTGDHPRPLTLDATLDAFQSQFEQRDSQELSSYAAAESLSLASHYPSAHYSSNHSTQSEASTTSWWSSATTSASTPPLSTPSAVSPGLTARSAERQLSPAAASSVSSADGAQAVRFIQVNPSRNPIARQTSAAREGRNVRARHTPPQHEKEAPSTAHTITAATHTDFADNRPDLPTSSAMPQKQSSGGGALTMVNNDRKLAAVAPFTPPSTTTMQAFNEYQPITSDTNTYMNNATYGLLPIIMDFGATTMPLPSTDLPQPVEDHPYQQQQGNAQQAWPFCGDLQTFHFSMDEPPMGDSSEMLGASMEPTAFAQFFTSHPPAPLTTASASASASITDAHTGGGPTLTTMGNHTFTGVDTVNPPIYHHSNSAPSSDASDIPMTWS
ncbi:fungal-specific transcription factor domain-domain-containing protein [Syncephalastrum racemosum]|uniref:Fungal-specific transcription factor domain-domain-containing protein n=1 Tax=Syncephalastrum racemosum TaxID=13706 RepID=A0A1X2HPG7_SYNRA|nr:fungal-specific transcription factor domain-domain-containing protein [Syncephalastrum racemosum]